MIGNVPEKQKSGTFIAPKYAIKVSLHIHVYCPAAGLMYLHYPAA
jgi:hypothetical protein